MVSVKLKHYWISRREEAVFKRFLYFFLLEWASFVVRLALCIGLGIALRGGKEGEGRKAIPGLCA